MSEELTPTEVRDLLSIAGVTTVDEMIEKLRHYLAGDGVQR
ncbi:hypothetical protein ACH0AH_07860 [Microbacterium paludicola]